MKIKIVMPVISDLFTEEVRKEVNHFKAPDTEIDIIHLDKGTASIESHYDEMLASYDIVEKTIQAEIDGFDGVFVDCFGDPGVDAAREMVQIPVVGGFQPAALNACLISNKWSVVTVLKSVIPMLADLTRKLGIDKNVASIRDINTPVLELSDKDLLIRRLLEQINIAVNQDGAEAIVLGCTGMLDLAKLLADEMKGKGIPIPVIDPTAAAIGYLEMMHRSGISHSKLTYMTPTTKERNI